MDDEKDEDSDSDDEDDGVAVTSVQMRTPSAVQP
jgi:hypothetical protein